MKTEINYNIRIKDIWEILQKANVPVSTSLAVTTAIKAFGKMPSEEQKLAYGKLMQEICQELIKED